MSIGIESRCQLAQLAPICRLSLPVDKDCPSSPTCPTCQIYSVDQHFPLSPTCPTCLNYRVDRDCPSSSTCLTYLTRNRRTTDRTRKAQRPRKLRPATCRPPARRPQRDCWICNTKWWHAQWSAAGALVQHRRSCANTATSDDGALAQARRNGSTMLLKTHGRRKCRPNGCIRDTSPVSPSAMLRLRCKPTVWRETNAH